MTNKDIYLCKAMVTLHPFRPSQLTYIQLSSKTEAIIVKGNKGEILGRCLMWRMLLFQWRTRGTRTSRSCAQCWSPRTCKIWRTWHRTFTTKTSARSVSRRYRSTPCGSEGDYFYISGLSGFMRETRVADYYSYTIYRCNKEKALLF